MTSSGSLCELIQQTRIIGLLVVGTNIPVSRVRRTICLLKMRKLADKVEDYFPSSRYTCRARDTRTKHEGIGAFGRMNGGSEPHSIPSGCCSCSTTSSIFWRRRGWSSG